MATAMSLRLRRRVPVGLLAVLVAYAGAVGAALMTATGSGDIASGVESVAGSSATWLGTIATVLPLGYAFGAGMVAAVNPCGFALLPAYLGLYLGDSDDAQAQRPLSRRFLRALWVSAMVSAGFVLLFGIAGLVLGVATSTVARYLPWLGLLIGVLLVLVAGRLLSGGMLYASLGERVATRLGAGAQAQGPRAYFAYGLAYGTASLSCTLPIFLTVVGSTLTVAGFLPTALQFVLYGLGMGFVITLLTLSTAFVKFAAIGKVRSVVRYVQPASVLLLLLAGAYIIYYWLTQGGLLGALADT